jgi:hypothetical protein
MSHYFFDLTDGRTVSTDKFGSDIVDLTTARERAADLASREIAYLKTLAAPYDPREYHVRAETGKCVAKVAFRYLFDD